MASIPDAFAEASEQLNNGFDGVSRSVQRDALVAALCDVCDREAVRHGILHPRALHKLL